MNAREELVWRIAARRRNEIGTLSNDGFQELLLAVKGDPASFVETAEEQAYATLDQALCVYRESLRDDDLLEDEQYLQKRAARLAKLAAAAQGAADAAPGCSDARLIAALAADQGPDELLDALLAIERDLYPGGTPAPGVLDANEPLVNIAVRPWLRLKAAIARTCLDGARAKMAIEAAEKVFEVDPADELGARCTAAIAYARLEDEKGFDALDARFSFHGNTWSNLARVILLYKLGRMSAARRALRGYDDLCEAGAYALLRPTWVEIYLPDRSIAKVGSLEEAMMAVHEADPTIVDTPDLIGWAEDQDWFFSHAEHYADDHDLDW